MSSAKTYICLDIGGTYIKHGLLTETGEILIKGKIPPGQKKAGRRFLSRQWSWWKGIWRKRRLLL